MKRKKTIKLSLQLNCTGDWLEDGAHLSQSVSVWEFTHSQCNNTEANTQVQFTQTKYHIQYEETVCR